MTMQTTAHQALYWPLAWHRGRLFQWLALIACAWLTAGAVQAQPAFGREVLPAPALPGLVTLAPPAAGSPSEVWHLTDGALSVRNVSAPTLQIVRPQGHGHGGAVIVAPGGGFLGLAYEREGQEVARWLASQGFVAFILKYRVLPTPTSQDAFIDGVARAIRGEADGIRTPGNTPPEALEDGVRALRWVRTHASEHGVDPRRVGAMGFSAGGFLVRSLIENGGSDRPDFGIAIYPRMTALNPVRPAPPLFVLIAADDFLLRGVSGLPIFDSYRAAGGAIALHVLPAGGHGFGLGRPGTPSEGWPDILRRWLVSQGLMSPAPTATEATGKR